MDLPEILLIVSETIIVHVLAAFSWCERGVWLRRNKRIKAFELEYINTYRIIMACKVSNNNNVPKNYFHFARQRRTSHPSAHECECRRHTNTHTHTRHTQIHLRWICLSCIKCSRPRQSRALLSYAPSSLAVPLCPLPSRCTFHLTRTHSTRTSYISIRLSFAINVGPKLKQ